MFHIYLEILDIVSRLDYLVHRLEAFVFCVIAAACRSCPAC